MYKLTNGNMVLDLTSTNGKSRFVSIEAEEYKQWLLDGGIPEPKFTDAELLEQAKASITSAIQKMLDDKAISLRWDDMKSARAAAGIPIPTNATVNEIAIITQAISLAQWYIKIWAKAGELEALGTVMTVDEVLAQMPAYV